MPVVVDGDFTSDLQYVVNGNVKVTPGYVTVFSDVDNLRLNRSSVDKAYCAPQSERVRNR